MGLNPQSSVLLLGVSAVYDIYTGNNHGDFGFSFENG